MPSVTVYDPLDAATLEDPYPVFAELRTRTPVFWHEGMTSWVLTRHADCVRVLRDHGLFARDPRRTGGTVPKPSLSVQTLDPPQQSRVRSLFMTALRAQDLATVEERARRLVAGRLDVLAAAGREFDVVAELAVPLSVAVVADLLGVEPPPYDEFAEVSDAIMRSMDGGLDPSLVEPGRIARQRLSDLVDGWFAASSRPGLLDHVRRAGPDADPLARLYVKNTARVMFQGGYSTMAAAVGNAVAVLLDRPEALEQMCDAALLATGVDELVRFDGPVQGTTRVAVRACRIGGVDVAAGQKVVALFAAANRDPDAFPGADRLVLERTPNPHLGYGWGPHSCIGTTVAQAGLRALVAALASYPVRLVAAGEGVRRRTATMRAYQTLPARFHR